LRETFSVKRAAPLSNKPLLLIVDDDPLISDSLSHAFAAEFDIVTSHARPHCLALLRQLRQTPQVALVDLGLPPQPHRPDEGFALIGELLAHAPEMKIIVLSGQNGDDNARHARTLGAVEFVGKPCDPGHLLTLRPGLASLLLLGFSYGLELLAAAALGPTGGLEWPALLSRLAAVALLFLAIRWVFARGRAAM